MTRVRHWKVAAVAIGCLAVLVIGAVIVTDARGRIRECTYYGSHSNLLRVGERVALSQDFRAAGDQSIAKAQAGIVQEEPAWDEDSCDPDRPIKVALASGAIISVPRHVLHRE